VTVPDARKNGPAAGHLADSPSWCSVVTTTLKRQAAMKRKKEERRSMKNQSPSRSGIRDGCPVGECFRINRYF
jgi:hypothetical protein